MLPPCFNYLDVVNSWQCVTRTKAEPHQLLSEIESHWQQQNVNNPGQMKMAGYVLFMKDAGCEKKNKELENSA